MHLAGFWDVARAVVGAALLVSLVWAWVGGARHTWGWIFGAELDQPRHELMMWRCFGTVYVINIAGNVLMYGV